MDFNIFDIFESITDAQIILSLNIESLFALAPNLSLLEQHSHLRKLLCFLEWQNVHLLLHPKSVIVQGSPDSLWEAQLDSETRIWVPGVFTASGIAAICSLFRGQSQTGFPSGLIFSSHPHLLHSRHTLPLASRASERKRACNSCWGLCGSLCYFPLCLVRTSKNTTSSLTPHVLQVFIQMSLVQWGHPWTLYPTLHTEPHSLLSILYSSSLL